VSYRGKVKDGNNNRKACDNVEHIFGEGFEHDPPPCRTLIRPNEHQIGPLLDKRNCANLASPATYFITNENKFNDGIDLSQSTRDGPRRREAAVMTPRSTC
jgi:hypothetical protein